MSFKEQVLKKQPNAFCCRATWGGWHIWIRGDAKLIGFGKTPNLAWKDCLATLK